LSVAYRRLSLLERWRCSQARQTLANAMDAVKQNQKRSSANLPFSFELPRLVFELNISPVR
jgi:hypothetical protein